MKIMRILSLCFVLMCTISCTSPSLWWGKEYEAPTPPEQISAPDFKENIYERTKDINTHSSKLDVDNDRIKVLIEQLKTVDTEEEVNAIITEIDSKPL